MSKIMDFVEEHVKAVSIVGGIALFILIQTLTSCSSSSANKPDRSSESKNEKVDTSEEDGDDTDAGSTPDVTDEQTSLIDGYTDDTEKVLEALKECTWIGEDGTGTLEFGDDVVKVSAPESGSKKASKKSVKKLTYAVAAMGTNPLMPQDASVIDYELAILAGDGTTHIMHVTTSVSADAENPGTTSFVSCDLFGDKEFTNRYTYQKLEIEGYEDSVLESALGKDSKKLVKALKEYMSVWNPTTAKVAWDGTLTYTEESKALTFNLVGESEAAKASGGDGSATVQVTYGIDEGTFDIEEAA